MKKITILACLFFSLIYSSEFSEINIKNISSSRILSLSQDSTGFFWLGTDEGLNRFDGKKNTVYRSNIIDEGTISGNRVWITHTDRLNNLWVATDRGVCYKEKESSRFKRVLTESRPVHILETNENMFFTTTNHGVLKISKKEKTITTYQFDPLDPFSLSSSKFSDKQATPIAVQKNIAWIGTTKGLNRVDLNSGHTKRLYSGKTNLVRGDTVNAVLIAGDTLYIGTNSGLGISDLAFGENLDAGIIKIKNKKIINIFKIKEGGRIGLILRNEIVILKGTIITQRIKTKKTLKQATSLKTGQYLITSNEHNRAVFLTTDNGKKTPLVFNHITTPIEVREVLVDQESGVWLAGESGLVRAESTTRPAQRALSKKIKQNSFSKQQNDLVVLEGNEIVTIKENRGLEITSDKTRGLNTTKKKIFTTEKNKHFLYDRALYQISNSGILKSLCSFDVRINKIIAMEGSVYISLQNSGLAHHQINEGRTTDFRKNRMLSKFLPSGASSFLRDGGRLWVGSDESGLYELDVSMPSSPKLIKHHTYIKSDHTSFSSGSVSSLLQHKLGLFVGTNGDGLFCYSGGVFEKITIQDGMPSNNIVSLSSSSDSTIWALTNGGLAHINWGKRDINTIGKKEGLSSFFRDENALFSKKDGNAFVVGPSGIQEVAVANLYKNEHEAFVVIESVELIDKNNRATMVGKEDIKAEHTTPIIRINLTAPCMYKAENTTFSYFIDGYHNSWIDNGERRYIELQGLDPGLHTIKIRSYNSDGYESKNTATISFQVVPPWWKTWWAYLFYISTTLAVFAYYVKYQKRAQAKATEDRRKEEELEEARQFQLDMLPRETPDDLGLDISATIETASEVGGDYYDYFPQKDKQSLYVVVGDATGHGMTAGMMVSITKAGLYGIPSIPPNDIAQRLNRVIKNIDLGWNRMAFNMARFWENKVEFTSAAMPPVYHYHSNTGKVDEVLLGGLPLGSIKDETFSLEEFDFNMGDSLVFISDGLPEAENRQGEMLGYEAVYDCVKANGKEGAEEQKQALLDLGSAWLSGLRNQDDITIVVVKKSNPLE